MAHTVQVERGKARRRMNTVVDGELDHRKRGAPRRGRRRTQTAEDVLNHAVGTLGLTVGLWMVLGRHIQLGAQQTK